MNRIIETPEDMRLLMNECVHLTYEWVEKCNKTFGLNMPAFRVEFSLKGTTAGMAYIGQKVIKYNPTLLRENPEAFLARTVGHEVVHHAAYAKYGNEISGHGEEWKRMMRKLGLPDTRCHSYDTSNVPTRVGKTRNVSRNNIIQTADGMVRGIGMGKVIDFD